MATQHEQAFGNQEIIRSMKNLKIIAIAGALSLGLATLWVLKKEDEPARQAPVNLNASPSMATNTAEKVPGLQLRNFSKNNTSTAATSPAPEPEKPLTLETAMEAFQNEIRQSSDLSAEQSEIADQVMQQLREHTARLEGGSVR